MYEEIEGDLIQRYNQYLARKGSAYAKRKLAFTVIRYLRPGILMRHRYRSGINVMVIYNYLVTSYRHILKFRLTALFKLTGLTLALFSLLVVTLYISWQLSFDKYHHDYERIYRVNTERNENGRNEQYGIAPLTFGSILQEGFPEVESFTRLDISNGSHLKFNNKVVWGGVFPADSSLFEVFTFNFVKGGKDALSNPNSIVLTKSMSDKIFGDEEPLHKMLTVDNSPELYEVTAVVEDIPYNSHFRVEAFVPMKRSSIFSIDHITSPPGFVDNSSVLFVKLLPSSEQSFLQRLDAELDKYVSRKDRERLGFSVVLQPLENIYLDPPLKYEFTRKGSPVYLYTFIILGVFLLCIACINYTNLSLANFMNRAKEIGVRKVMGGSKSQIAFQVAMETWMYCLVAFALSIGMLYLLFPKIQEYIEPHLAFSMMTDRFVVSVILILFFLLVLMSTTLPAFWFATSKASSDLKGRFMLHGKLSLNQSLLFAQFVISIICLFVTLSVARQIDYIHNKDLGLDRNNLLILTMPEDLTTDKMIALKSGLKSLSGVTHVSNSSFRIGGSYWKDWYTVEVDGELKSFELYEVFSDDELFATLGMKVKAGRVFDAEHRADSGAAFVINETAARQLGLDDPVGKRIFTHPEEPGKWDGTIVGVVNDINISTLHHKIQPLVMRLPWQKDYPEYFVYVRISGSSDSVIRAIKDHYHAIQPGFPLEIHFVDDFYNDRYERENKAFASLQFGTLIILLISSLGIFSLSAYMSVRRMKEFGIRKVLGASSQQITQMHVAHFLKVALFACAVGVPVSSFFMDEWLQQFAYRTEPGAGVIATVVTLMLFLIVLSAGYYAHKSGRVNPSEIINKL